jgi:hypothetical protein
MGRKSEPDSIFDWSVDWLYKEKRERESKEKR